MNSTPPIVGAYYFPNYHQDPRNAYAHGPGWTEWELVKAATPRFPGHRQPLVPVWGYEDEADPQVMARKIDAAADHGVDCFIYDWYWFEDGMFLERGLEEGFLKAENKDRIKFCCMWANHDWKNIQPAKRNTPSHLQYPGTISRDSFERLTDYVIEHYFAHPAHLKIDGAPYFSIYFLKLFLNIFDGSVDEARRALDRFRAKTVAAGFPGLHLNLIMWHNGLLSGETTEKDVFEIAARLGVDSCGGYVWVHYREMSHEAEPLEYDRLRDYYFEWLDQARQMTSLPVHPNVTMGWDSTPRTVQTDVWDPSLGYPFTQIVQGNTPEAFREALQLARQRAAGQMVTLNAWNEWTEGSYLEPDTVHGLRYLEAIREVFPPRA